MYERKAFKLFFWVEAWNWNKKEAKENYMHAICSTNLTVYLYMVFMSWSDPTNLVTLKIKFQQSERLADQE